MAHCVECIQPRSKKGKVIPGKEVPAKEGSVFCEACQPNVGATTITRSGDFLPHQDMMVGDAEFAQLAKDIYDAFGFTKGCEHKDCPEGDSCDKRYSCPKGHSLHYKFANHYDAVGIFARADGTIVRRISLRDFFSTAFTIIVKDI